MIEVGRVVMKIAGRDAGQLGVIVDVLDDRFVLVDGLVRRRKCNLKHLEFLNFKVKVKKGASSEEVKKALSLSGFNFADVKKGKKREAVPRPRKIRKSKNKEIKIEGETKNKK